MRQSLMTSFDQLHVLNLHGNSLKKEKSPDGTKDENVFDIQQGVAILLAVKKSGLQKGVWEADLWGTRECKYKVLGESQAKQTEWQELAPRSGTYLFVPQDDTLAAEYEKWPKVTDIFPVSSVGIVTARDDLTINMASEGMWNVVQRFVSMNPEEARAVFKLGDDARDWKVGLAQEDLRKSGPSREHIAPILYRPFDIRYTYYTGQSRGFQCMPRPEVMQNLLDGRTLALLVCRQTVSETWQHALVASSLTDDSLVSNKTRERGYVLPLYVHYYRDHADMYSNGHGLANDPQPNLSASTLTMLHEYYGGFVQPETVLAYIYAVLYSPAFRTRYAGFLKADFPHIPFTKDRDTFTKLAGLGQQLIDLHLMRSPELDNPISRFCGKGDSGVTRITYDSDHQRAYINATQCFDNVSPDLWSYQIGGYQVLSKWLKDRTGRFLTAADSKHYSQVVTLLRSTTVIQRQIDVMFQRM